MPLIQMTVILINKEEIWRQTSTEVECHVKIGVMLPQAKELEVGRVDWKHSSQVLQRIHGPADSLMLDFQSPEL